MNDEWESTFRNWSKPSSDTEEQKCDNAVKMIRDAISESSTLDPLNIMVYAQGSYRNNTNVRQESDVDVCICCQKFCIADYSYSGGLSNHIVGLQDGKYKYNDYKNDIERALVNKFGRSSVSRGNKAINIHANSYRVDADAVPCFEHRRYTGTKNSDGTYHYFAGTHFFPDNGGEVINWPQQHYENGVNKNRKTGSRFKYITRVLKRLKHHMSANSIVMAEKVPSYLIECLMWNVPNEHYGNDKYADDIKNALIYIYSSTKDASKCHEWGEVNDLKYLFRNSQPWTREQANLFCVEAWNYIGYE